MVNSSSGWNPAAGLRGGQPLEGMLERTQALRPPAAPSTAGLPPEQQLSVPSASAAPAEPGARRREIGRRH